jgi:hypothetical protein
MGLDDLEVLEQPRFPAYSRGHVVAEFLGHGWNGVRAPNPENPGRFITIIAREGSEPQIPLQTLAVWEQSRIIQEALNQQISKAEQAVTPWNANIPDFLKGYDRTSVIYATVGMAPEGPG